MRVTTLDDGCSAMIPCDIALLASSNLDGSAFLETANLDGETNLKVHQPACLPHIHCLYVRLACVACLDNRDGDHSFETANLEAQTHLKVCQPPDPPAHALSVGQSVGLSLLVLSAVRHKKLSTRRDHFLRTVNFDGETDLTVSLTALPLAGASFVCLSIFFCMCSELRWRYDFLASEV